ncbi:MAG: hypothetical protein IPL97_03510 [Niastella sp.]|nr:hypothetical protein [Niastella sp.]
MRIIPITEKDNSLFIQVAVRLYQQDPLWIRPLDKDINDVFDKNKNKAFRFGEVKRWIVQTEAGELIGRIAAFINKKYKNKNDDGPVGGVGFFECINDQSAANLLFDTAKNWLQTQGVQAMDGPINFGERDRWWGLVTQGYKEPLYCMNYNPPYYVTLFEEYGFNLFYNQVCYGRDPQQEVTEKIIIRHHEYAKDPDFKFETLKKNKLDKYAADFATVYNKAWAGHGGMKQMTVAQATSLFNRMKPVLDPKIACYVYYKNEPIAIFLNLPDLNQYFKYMNGKFGLLQKLYFLYLLNFKPIHKFTGLVFGIVPEWQGKGIDAYLIYECSQILRSPPRNYTEYEMQWIGDFNPKMLNVAETLGGVWVTRNLVTYRYLFDREKPFNRHPFLN